MLYNIAICPDPTETVSDISHGTPCRSSAMSDTKKYVIGVDGGTGGIRAGVFDLSGNPCAFADVPYETSFPHPGWAEQSPQSWLDGLYAAVRAAMDIATIDAASVIGMSVDTTCCSVCALDDRGAPLMPCVLWMDMRAADETSEVAATKNAALKVNCDGAGPVSAEWMVPKSLWIKKNRPEVFQNAKMICEYQDYINLKLTGRYCGSANNVAVRWHFDGKEPPTTMLEALGLEALLDKWPKDILGMGSVVGPLVEEAANACGLPIGLPVVQGGADAFVGMVGLGVIESGQLALITGSSHLHLGVASSEFHAPGIFGTYKDALVPTAPYVVEGGQTSTGSVVKWFKDLCGGGDDFYERMNSAAVKLPPGCEGVTVLDHFQGNRTPHVDALSRGVISGLTLKHSQVHVYRAILESVCCGTRLIFETMARGGYTPKEVVVAGGATRSELWLQIHADVTGIPHVVTECTDAPALGCAILAAVGAGAFPDVKTAVDTMVRKVRVVRPDPDAHALYTNHVYPGYLRMYPALRDVWGAQRAVAQGAGRRAIVCPSLLAADQGALASEVNRMLDEGADWLHVDIMDGHFVPNLTIGPPVVADLAKRIGPRDAFFDCHLSVNNPATLVPGLAAAGASSVTFHIEVASGDEARQLCRSIRSHGMRAAIACKPSTSCEDSGITALIEEGLVDMVLCLSVEPGFGGQKFNPAVLEKVTRLRAAFPSLDIQMDGGVNPTTAPLCAAAGANVLVAGSAVFGAKDPASVISALRQSIIDAHEP